MAKIGIDSFLLDCHTNDDNISEIEAEYGVKGFAVVVRLWQKIYFEKGYYCEWVERSPLLFLANWFGGNSGVTVNLIMDIVDRCLKNGIFNAKMFENYSILTSTRIQEQYFDVVKRREKIPVKKEYLLVSVDKINGIVYENAISAYRNLKNVCRNDISKVKESKEDNKNNLCKADADSLFERLWKMYPVKMGKARVSESKKMVLLKIGFDEMSRAIERYLAELKKDSWRKPQYGSTFFNSGHIDYLDANYVPGDQAADKTQQQVKKGSFNNFQQNDYDFGKLEEELRSN